MCSVKNFHRIEKIGEGKLSQVNNNQLHLNVINGT